jgi:hypothetical protein
VLITGKLQGGIEDLTNLLQVGHITCDNAKNNDTMLEEFRRCYEAKTGDQFDTKRRQIRYGISLHHVVALLNLQTLQGVSRISLTWRRKPLFPHTASQSFTVAISKTISSLMMWVLSNVMKLAFSVPSVSRFVLICYCISNVKE